MSAELCKRNAYASKKSEVIEGSPRKSAGNNSHASLFLRKIPQSKTAPLTLLSAGRVCAPLWLISEVLVEEFRGGCEEVVGGNDAD